MAPVLDRVGPVVLVEGMDPADRAALARVAPVGLADPAALAAPVLDRAALVVPGRVAPVGLADPVDLAVLGRAGLADRAGKAPAVRVGRTALADRVDLMALADPTALADRVDRVAPAGLADPMVARAAPMAPAGLADPMARVDRVDQVDRRRRRTCNAGSTTGVTRNGVAHGMLRTDSARRITVRRPRHRRVASVGTVGRHPEGRRPTGTDHRLPEAGTDRLLPGAGTRDGTGRRATSVTPSVISGGSITMASTPSRCSIRSSADGASGTSATGFRCTDV